MPLDPYLIQTLETAAKYPPLRQVPLEKLRAGAAFFCNNGLPPVEVHSVENILIPGPQGGIRTRLYRPPSKQQSGLLPITVFFHGGGFVFCSIESHDQLCRTLCKESGSLVLSVDYALSPEHKFPSALADCLAVTEWVSAHAKKINGDPAQIALAGDSAGGNLAAVTALEIAKKRNGQSNNALLLMYPVTDHYSGQHPSYIERGQGFGLSREDMIWFWDNYLPNSALAKDPRVSPLRATNLEKLPPTFVITAEYDLLRDEGEAFAKQLIKAGVPTKLVHVEDANHGFLFWTGLVNSATKTMEAAGAWLKEQTRRNCSTSH